MREKGHQRWNWVGRRVMGLSRCFVHGRCCRGWWRLNHHSVCSDPCCSGAPGSYTVTADKMKEGAGVGRNNKGMFSVIIGELQGFQTGYNLNENANRKIILSNSDF